MTSHRPDSEFSRFEKLARQLVKTPKDPNAVALGRKGGLVGGKARAAAMTPEQRSEAASKASRARWSESLAEVDARTENPMQRWSKEAAIEALQAFFRRHRRSPTTKETARSTQHGIPSHGTLLRIFGSHNKALKAAGLPVRPQRFEKDRIDPVPPLGGYAKGPPVFWTEERTIEALQSYYAKHGQSPRAKGDREGLPSEHTVTRLFGSHNKALEAAGLPIRLPGSHSFRNRTRPEPVIEEFSGWRFDNRKGQRADVQEMKPNPRNRRKQ